MNPATLPRLMSIFDRLERRFGWLAFPGFLRYYALLHVLVFMLQFVRPGLFEVFMFDRDKILAGEVWRIATMFFAASQFGGADLISIIFLAFAVMFTFMISDGLENSWGTFKNSLFFYCGILSIWIASFLFPSIAALGGLLLFLSAFFAFATLFPKYIIYLFMVIPVQIRFLAFLSGAGIILSGVMNPTSLLPYYLMIFSNYLIWAGVPALLRIKQVVKSGQRRKTFEEGKRNPTSAFHNCAICEKNDVTHPQLDFRIGKDDLEYCPEHLPE